MDSAIKMDWQAICHVDDLVPGAGVCALVANVPIAIFYLPDTSQKLYALDDWDPVGGASVMSRGIVGDVDGRLVVASPLYKQHFDLLTGECLEDAAVALNTYPVRLDDNEVLLATGD